MMNSCQLLCLNLKEIRRRSKILWLNIPADVKDWKPDPVAMSPIEMIRHILESQYFYHRVIAERGEPKISTTPWEGRPYISIEEEVEFSEPYFNEFLEFIGQFSDQDLDEIEISRPKYNQRRKLGDYILRAGYHESVHAGQLLSYLRSNDIQRPLIWD
jgi:DinB superfamily